MTVSSEVRQFVRSRADNSCEYCRLPSSQSGRIIPLYHPRQQPWVAHFQFAESSVVGLTPEGRATVALLNMNADERVQLRRAMLRRGWTP